MQALSLGVSLDYKIININSSQEAPFTISYSNFKSGNFLTISMVCTLTLITESSKSKI